MGRNRNNLKNAIVRLEELLGGVHFGLQLDSSDDNHGRGENGKCLKCIGGPGRVRTVDLFHAM